MSNTIESVAAANASSWDTTTKKSSGMDMQGFLKLMAAQMQNQSVTSQTDDSQYITEMTLYTAIQALNTQTAESNKQYAASLVGSDVLISTTDKSTGAAKQVSGTVTKAVFSSSSDSAGVQIGDTIYNISNVAQVLGYHSSGSDSATRQYAASLIGKSVTVQTTDSTTGTTGKETGKVQNVAFDSSTGAAALTLENGKSYDVSDVIQVLEDGASVSST